MGFFLSEKQNCSIFDKAAVTCLFCPPLQSIGKALKKDIKKDFFFLLLRFIFDVA